MHRIFTTPFASVYPLYVTKIEKKQRTKSELDQVISWLTGFNEGQMRDHLAAETTFEDFFAAAQLNPNAELITGVVCGVRVESIEDPLMQKIRYLDKLVDELAKGKPMEKVLRGVGRRRRAAERGPLRVALSTLGVESWRRTHPKTQTSDWRLVA